jgi:hypothetical protein
MSPSPRRAISLILLMFLLAPAVRADVVELKPDHPERYVVQKGDTLWAIANRFLKSPWNWARIWKGNQQIRNPHLIYPGDVLVLRWVDGQPEIALLPTERLEPVPAPLPAEPAGPDEARPTGIGIARLSPRVHSEPIETAIPTIPPEAIAPFLTRPLAVGRRELEDAGYVTVGLDDRLALGDNSEFYARGLRANGEEFFHVVRQGAALRHPDTRELLGYEAIYLGDAQLLETGDPTKLVVTSVKQEIVPGDRLLAAKKRAALPYYYPHAPKSDVRGYIIAALNAVAEVGPLSVVTVSLGEREGIEEGHVLRVMRHVGRHRDPVTKSSYRLPDEDSGLLLVFRTFEKVSFALVMQSTRPVHINDAVVTP